MPRYLRTSSSPLGLHHWGHCSQSFPSTLEVVPGCNKGSTALSVLCPIWRAPASAPPSKMAAPIWRPPYLPYETPGQGLTRPERDAKWSQGSSPQTPGVECLVTGTSARGGGGGGSGSKAGALAIKPEAAALATVFGAGQLRGACWSRSRTLCRGLRCVSSSADPAVSGGPGPPFPRRGPGLRAWRPRREPGRARRGGARRAEVGGHGVTRRAAGTGTLGLRASSAAALLAGKRYRPATEAALPGASHAPARRGHRETGAFRVLHGRSYFEVPGGRTS